MKIRSLLGKLDIKLVVGGKNRREGSRKDPRFCKRNFAESELNLRKKKTYHLFEVERLNEDGK